MFDRVNPFMSYRLRLSPLDEQVVTRINIGDNKYPLLIVDNFYQNPELLAQFVHKQVFFNPNGKHINALATVKANTHKIYQFIYQHYAKQWGVEQFNQLKARQNVLKFHRSLNSGSHLPIRREDPHSDGKFFLAGLVYLTPDQYCKGGTGFYKFRQTGAEEKPPSKEWFRSRKVTPQVINKLNEYNVYRAFEESTIDSYSEFLKLIPFKTQDNKYHLISSNDTWELTHLVPMKFNRLILYPAFIMHKAIYPEDGFDGTNQQRRLTQNFFFKYPT